MATAPRQRRQQDFKPGRVTGWPADFYPELVESLNRNIHYAADGKHKDYPAPSGEWDYRFRAEGTKCPRIPESQWSQLTEALRQAFEAGVVQWDDRCVTFPVRAWIRVDRQLCEARLTNRSTGEYHGFPLDYEEHFPSDPDDRLANAPEVLL